MIEDFDEMVHVMGRRLRAWGLWALLLGQPVLFASYWTGIGWRWVDSSLGPVVIIATLSIAGALGVLGEVWWRRHKDA